MTNGVEVLARYSPGRTLAVCILFFGTTAFLMLAPGWYGGWDQFLRSSRYAAGWPIAIPCSMAIDVVCLVVLGRILFVRGAAVWISAGRLYWAPLGAKIDLDKIVTAKVGQARYGAVVSLGREDGTLKTIPTGLLDVPPGELVARITALLPTSRSQAGAPS